MSNMNCPECTESWAADECLPCWDVPDFKCPCLDMGNPDHVRLWMESWRVASSYVFNTFGQRWPGKCVTETVRPCVPQQCPPKCVCYSCGTYNYLNIDKAFCWPICEIVDVTIYPTACEPDGAIWTEGNGYRTERVMGTRRLVIENTVGCCGTFPRQDLCKPLGENGTWSITAITGCSPPPEILRGTAALACDIAQDCVDTGCGLPAGVTGASFNGVTVNYGDNGSKGKTLDIQMLRDLADKYGPEPVEQFLNPCDPIMFHHVDGPRRNYDVFPETKRPTAGQILEQTQTTSKDSLGIYSVSPVA